MSTLKPHSTVATRMSGIREDWLRLTQEEVLEPDLAIVDPHHHLWDFPSHRYRRLSGPADRPRDFHNQRGGDARGRCHAVNIRDYHRSIRATPGRHPHRDSLSRALFGVLTAVLLFAVAIYSRSKGVKPSDQLRLA